MNVDSDGDGNTENDADLTGDVQWKDVSPGEYQINLSVTNSAGKMDGDKIKVYVSFYGYWAENDWQIGSGSANDPEEIEFEVPVVYDKEIGNTIRKLEAILTYPQIDDDCQDVTPGEGNNCRNKLDIFATMKKKKRQETLPRIVVILIGVMMTMIVSLPRYNHITLPKQPQHLVMDYGF